MTQNDRIKIKSLILKQGNKKILDLKGDEISSIKIYPEKNISPYWRTILDKNKDCIMHKQNFEDIESFLQKIPHTLNEKGQPISKCEIWACIIPPKPKSSQAKAIGEYKKILAEFFETKKDNLQKFKELKLLIYLCVYLSKKRFSTDVDNLAKPIIDSLKPYFGDDSKILTLIVEKKQLYEDHDPKDFDYLENSLIIISDAIVRNDLVKV